MKGTIRGVAGLSAWSRLLFVAAVVLLVRQDAFVPRTNDPKFAMPSGATTASGRLIPRPLPPRQAIPTDAAAARFLAQATFGPTLDDIAYLRTRGYQRWLSEQFAMPPSYQLPYLDAVDFDAGFEGQQFRTEAWFLHALGGPNPFVPAIVHRDQLRQRIAFALSEIFVVSDRNDFLFQQPFATASYYDVLIRNSFGNYRQLLEETTLHPAMGLYLSMIGNQKPDPALNVRPDENFAREVLQLFSVGLVRLNRDGTPMLDQMGRPIPTYDQSTVKGFAHVFTGWNFPGCGDYPSCYYVNFTAPAWRTPMVSYPAFHASANSKQLLAYPRVALPGGVLAAGGTGPSDLQAALDNIFHHPNLGPFIGRQLIQRLTTSNPTPGYVARVAARFDNNGGVRGDMKAVIRAILLDREARHVGAHSPRFGKVREPILRLTHLWRALDASSQSGRIQIWYPDQYLGQAAMRSPSVFNFFSPFYKATGELSELGMLAPELQLATDFQLPITDDALGDAIYLTYIRGPHAGEEVVLDLNRDAPLAANPEALVDRYNTLFLSGQMSSQMRQVLLDHLNATPNGNSGRNRVREALYLIVNSPEYIVQK